MILIDCSELSADEKLALASQVSDRLEGIAVALVKGQEIALDELSPKKPDLSSVKGAVDDFVSRRKDGGHYSVEVDGERIVVHAADPIKAAKRKMENQLPPNLHLCPHCSFVTPYEELMMVHKRAHYIGV